MKSKRQLTLILLMFSASIKTFSTSDIYFSRIGIEQGLSQLTVNSIYQDELGAIWLGTREGVNKFNGNNVEVFTPNPNDSNSLAGSLVTTVCGDKNGSVFILSQKGLNQYSQVDRSMKLLKTDPVDAIAYGTRYLWIATVQKLNTYRNDKLEPYLELPQIKSAIKRIYETSDQRIFIGTLSSGLFVIDQNKKVKIVLADCSQVSSIFEDNKKNVWVGTWQHGLYKIDRNSKITNYMPDNQSTESSISSNFVRAICQDNNGFIWIGTKKGLDRLNPETGVFKHNNADDGNYNRLSNESVWALLKDSQGSIWVGTYFGGVNYFNPEIDFYSLHNLQKGVFLNKPFPIISQIIEKNDGKLFLCTEGSGLIIYDLTTRKYQNFQNVEGNANSLTNDNIKVAYYDADKELLWLGLHLGGLCKFDVRTSKFTRYKSLKPDWEQSDIVRAIVPYNGKLIVGTYNGIFLFDPNTERFELFSEKLNKVVSFAVDVKLDAENNVWIAGNGLHRFNPRTTKIDTFINNPTDSNSLGNNNVVKLLMTKDNKIWVATGGGGVNLLDIKTQKFRRFNNKTAGLKNNYVSNIIESSFGYLIISTTQGFSILDVENNKLLNYDADNGLPLNSLFNGGMCRTKTDEIFIAGMNGMVSFYEENLSLPTRSFNLNLVNLWINNKLVLPNDETNILKKSLEFSSKIRLNHKQSMITIEFASNNYISANQPIYRYKLLGFSDNWIELPASISKLNFMNLDIGKYKLLVEALSKTDGTVIARSYLDIVIYPPFYRTWLAYLFYILVIAFAIWRYIVFIRSRLLLQTSLTYEKKQKEHLEEVNQSKLRFFTNISHEFRTPLTLIVGQIDMLLQMQKIQPYIYNRILSIKRNTLNMQNLITELLEFRKSEQGHLTIKVVEKEFVPFLYEIYLSFSEYASFRNIKLNFICEEENIKLYFDPIQMQKVFYNLISNAFKYTPKNGVINITVTQTPNEVSIQVDDSGIGISSDAIAKIFDRFYQAENGLQISNMVPGTGIGLSLVKNILELHKANILVESQPEVGTKFTVVLKKGRSHYAEDQIGQEDEHIQQKAYFIDQVDEDFMQEIIDTQVVDNKPNYSMLIVEDNDELRSMLVTIFEPIYQIFTATDGVEGLELTVEKQPDIVLSDLMMPNMSGSEMCSKIKNNFTVCHIPVVLLTAQTAIESNIEGLRLGADDYITKPFNVKTLITRCNNLVNGRKILQEKFSKNKDFTARQIATNTLDREFLEKAQAIVEQNFDNSDFDVPYFSREMALGRTNLFNKIKGITGQTPNDFIITVKMKKAMELLLNHPEMNISDITYNLGFSTPKYFSKCFKEQFGISPSSYRKSEEAAHDVDENELES